MAYIPPAKRNKLVVGVLVILLLIFYVSRSSPVPAGLATPEFSWRSEFYCKRTPPTGDEGEHSKGMKLLGVTLLIRHGDRSAIHSIPGTTAVPEYNCSNLPTWDPRIRSYSENDGKPLPDRQPPFEVTKPSDPGHCLPGQLSHHGFQQLSQIGSFLHSRYSPHIATTGSNIYCRSTDYARTLNSAASFLSEFSKAQTSADSNDQLKIHVFEKESDETMHGVGVRGQSAGSNQPNRPSSGEQVIMGGCNAAVTLSESQRKVYRKPGHLAQDLAVLFGTRAAEKSTTDLADAIHAGACHEHSLPCGDGGCLSATTAAALLKAADQFYCDRFAGSNGGLRAAKLAMYPFMKSVSTGLQSIAEGTSKTPFRVYFGHDTVIAPILSSLGAFDCRWPPYASRIAIELWSDESTPDSHLVRILYNGKHISRNIEGCTNNGCKLQRFRRIVEGLYSPHESHAAACAVSQETG
eukprot:TRINITY_DN10545_c0_g1_i1.p1 TRINITY_DN10545_c0_g1~~TRINITY_DN10545_c0_g1_i1.p1  ORF type:complete len:464 (+),score=55.13 TRINITY_DN10545_c0_g1_i1:43-1434(+)